jgi:hypothetical protein
VSSERRRIVIPIEVDAPGSASDEGRNPQDRDRVIGGRGSIDPSIIAPRPGELRFRG